MLLGFGVSQSFAFSVSCPCIPGFCPCCLDRCRIGFIKLPKSGCRDLSGGKTSSVALHVGPTGTTAAGEAGDMGYGGAQTHWAAGDAGSSPGFGLAALEFLGYQEPEANVSDVFSGAWASKVMGVTDGKPYLQFCVLAQQDADGFLPAAPAGQYSRLDLSTGRLYRQADLGEQAVTNGAWREGWGTSFGGVESVGALSPAGLDVGGLYVSVLEGRSVGAAHVDFHVGTYNPEFYRWYNCPDSSLCMLVIVLGVMTGGLGVALGLSAFFNYAGSNFLIELLTQSFSIFCGLFFGCHKQCSYGTISVGTEWYVRVDSDLSVATDTVLNGMSLNSNLFLVQGGTTGLQLSSAHYRGPLVSPTGQPLQLFFKGTIANLGTPHLAGSGDKAIDVLITPPRTPSELMPGLLFGIEKKN